MVDDLDDLRLLDPVHRLGLLVMIHQNDTLLAHVQKPLVPGAVVLHGRPVRFAQAVIAVFLRGEELFFQLLEF